MEINNTSAPTCWTLIFLKKSINHLETSFKHNIFVSTVNASDGNNIFGKNLVLQLTKRFDIMSIAHGSMLIWKYAVIWYVIKWSWLYTICVLQFNRWGEKEKNPD
jgi:hypothetical protein